jgi:hypothetical protein
MKYCEFCPKMYNPRKCNLKRQRCCGSAACQAALKALLQRKYLKEGYWKSDCVRFKRRRSRHRQNFKRRNPDIDSLFDGIRVGFLRVLERSLQVSSSVLESIANEFEVTFNDLISSPF